MKRPIFIHAGLRSGSTYFWSKFRDIPTVMAFYEPFSEDLGRATRHFMLTHGPDSWSSRHAPTAPYYREYEPLLEDDRPGIHGFHPSFSYVNYFLNTPALPEQHAYLDALLALARSKEKQPVLGFCRSLGRTAWMRRHFPEAFHIVMVRNPVDQWLSGYYFHQSTHNPYFLINPVWCLRHPGDHPYAAAIAPTMAELMDQPALPLSALYEVFLQVYAAGLITALHDADLIVDIDLLTASPTYRRAVEESLTEATGLALDFADCHIATYREETSGVDFVRVTDRVVASLSSWIRDEPRANNWPLRHPWALLSLLEVSARRAPRQP
ncbi:MAG: hypothetical protein OWU84_04030 [Firmicutes bacterium]|nr:hypothetical protein [Bacillota bacterium]